MNPYDAEEEAEINAERAAGETKSRWLNAGSDIANALLNTRNAAEILLGQSRPQNDFGASFRRAADGITDPIERRKKAMEYVKAKRLANREQALSSADSQSSKDYSSMLSGAFPKLAQFFEGKSYEDLKEMAPILMQKARGDEDRALRMQEMATRSQDRREALQAKAEEKAQKQKELSATQAKQRGLYEIGKKSEEQFNTAVANKDEYDPTQVGQWIDNSNWAPNLIKNNKAIEAQNAQASWIESYLRDASGAAIPESERESYAKIYFPQPGDSAESVKNKAALRAQKMDSARIAAGVEPQGDSISQIASTKSPQDLAREELLRRKAAKQTAGK